MKTYLSLYKFFDPLCLLLLASLCLTGCPSSDSDTHDAQEGLSIEDIGPQEEPMAESDLSLEEGKPPCQTPASRVKWIFRTPGPDSIYAITWVEDADSDQVPDVLVLTDNMNGGQNGNPTYLYLLSGASDQTATVIWQAAPENLSAQTGAPIFARTDTIDKFADVNADGISEILVGVGAGNNSAYLLDGASGKTLWLFDTHTEFVSGDVFSIRTFPDINQDQTPEILFGTTGDLDTAFLLDGHDGRVIWRYPTFPREDIYSVAASADINSDGYPEALLGTGGAPDGCEPELCNTVAISSNPLNRDGEMVYEGQARKLWKTNNGAINAMIPVDDLNQDGKPDVVTGTVFGLVQALSGREGKILWSYQIENKEVMLVLTMQLVSVGDVNQDGVPDIAVGSSAKGVPVLSGKDGALLWTGEASEITWAVDRINDLTGDGISDVVSGSFDQRVRAYDGSNGTLLWDYDTGVHHLLVVRSIPDLTGDGAPDVVAGTQVPANYAPLENDGAGTVFLLEGCPN